MPLYSVNNFCNNTILALWKITEASQDLSVLLGNSIEDLQSINKKHKHWLASRLLLKEIFPQKRIRLEKDEFNKPHLFVDGKPFHISITHSHDFAAIIVSDKQAVSIDLERIDERVERVSSKFINDEERRFFLEMVDVKMLTVVWSAKETLYKLYGKKELDFKAHLTIKPFTMNDKIISGIIYKNDFLKEVKMELEIVEDCVMTYVR